MIDGLNMLVCSPVNAVVSRTSSALLLSQPVCPVTAIVVPRDGARPDPDELINLVKTKGSAHAPNKKVLRAGFWSGRDRMVGKYPGILRCRCGADTTISNGLRAGAGRAIAGESGNHLDR